MEFAVDRRTGRLDICDIKEMTIGATRISCTHRLTHDRVHTLTTGNIGCFTTLFLTTRYHADARP